MTVNTLASLKLTTAKKPRSLPAIVKKRAKLLQKLGEQRELALAQVEDRNYVPKRLRTVRDISTGERVVREMPVRIKPWWWMGERGEILFAVFYGSKTLELSKGKSAIELTKTAELLPAIDIVINAVKNSELDVQLEIASNKLRDAFKK
ncbi:MAG: DUF6641 family protein [Betaproteobacteria bacterium]|jgi:hypothetical protein